MGKSKKYLVRFLLTVFIFGSMSTFLSKDVSASTTADFAYEVISSASGNKTVTITGYMGSDETVTIPEKIDGYKVTAIGEAAFYGGTFKNITISKYIKTIGNDAFAYCDLLTDITIPKTVTFIGEQPFRGCYELEEISVNEENKYYESDNGVLYEKTNGILVSYPIGKEGIYYTVKSGTTKIGASAFILSSLKKITVPNSVKMIGESAFSDCTDLTGITIPKSVTTIGNRAFQRAGITSIKLSNGVKTIGEYAFDGCPNLESVELSKNVKSIEEGAFSFCDKLEVFIVAENNSYYEAVDGVLYDKAEAMLHSYPPAKTDTTYTVKSKTQYIGAYAFAACNHLETVVLQKGINIIGTRAFYACEQLENITLPDGLTTVNPFAFQFCSVLESITIPTSVSMSFDVFEGCESLTDIYYSGTKAQWKKLKWVKTAGINTSTVKVHYNECSHTSEKIINAKKATYYKNGYTGDTVCANCEEVITKGKKIYKASKILLAQKEYEYTGKKVTPAVVVYDSKGNKLIKDVDYTLEYENGRKNVREYDVMVCFQGDYSGTKKRTFTINPVATSVKKLTATDKGFKVLWKKQTEQITGYQICYSKKGDFSSGETVRVANVKAGSKTISKLVGRKRYYVKIRTYHKVGNKTYYSQWSDAKSIVTKK